MFQEMIMNQIDTVSDYVSSHAKLLERQVAQQLKRAGIFLAVNVTGALCLLVSGLYYVYFGIKYVIDDPTIKNSIPALIFFGVLFLIGILILLVGNYALKLSDSDILYKSIDRKKKLLEDQRRVSKRYGLESPQGIKSQKLSSDLFNFKNILILGLSILIVAKIPALKQVLVKKSFLETFQDKIKAIDLGFLQKQNNQNNIYRDLLISLCLPLVTKVIQGFFESNKELSQKNPSHSYRN